MADREASVHHRYTAFLAQRAGGMIVRWTIGGGVLGLMLGAVTLTGWAHWPVSHSQGYFVAALGAVCGAFLGRAIGSGRAQMVLFQAQLAQHQHEFERRLLEVGAAVAAQPQVPPESYGQVQSRPDVQPQPVPEAPAASAPEPAPVYLSEPSLAFGREFALPELPELPEPQPAFASEQRLVDVEPEPQPVSFEPTPLLAVAPEPAFQPQPAIEPQPAVEPVVALDPEPAPAPGTFLPEPAAFLPEPAAFALEPVVAFEPESAPAAVVPLVPRSAPAAPEAPLAPAPTLLPVPPLASTGVPPLTDDVTEPGADGDPSGYGWWRPGVSEQ